LFQIESDNILDHGRLAATNCTFFVQIDVLLEPS
jgi:hypothetical protein